MWGNMRIRANVNLRVKPNRVRMCVRTVKNGAPGAIPTRDLPLRRRTLYAAELREHMCEESYHVNPVNHVILSKDLERIS